MKAPNWAKDAYPTTRGWFKGKEHIIARKYTQAEVDAWFEANRPKKVVEPVVEAVVEAPVKRTYRRKKSTTVESTTLDES